MAKEPPLKDPDTTFAQQTTSMLTISVFQLYPVDLTFLLPQNYQFWNEMATIENVLFATV